MSLKVTLEKEGNWLFKRRGFLPLVLFPVATLIILNSEPGPYFNSLGWNIFALAVSLAGLVVRALVVGYAPAATSGRNTSNQVAEKLNTKGMYSMIRHPLYLGNFLMWTGPVIFLANPGFFICTCLAYWLYYERIMYAEECFLASSFGADYDRWSEKIPAFIPSRLKWIKPDLSFSLKNVLKREYSGILATGVTFAFLNLMQHVVYQDRLHLDIFWQVVLVLSFIAAITLKYLKKYTGMLNVPGR